MIKEQREIDILDEMRMNNMFKNKTLLITGGTGSFGNVVLDKFLKNGYLRM